MKILSTLIIATLMFSCQPDLKEKESEEAYKKGIETLETLLEDGEPDYKKAREHFAHATQLNPDNISAQFWKADAELKLGKFDESFSTSITALDKSEINHRLRPYILVNAGISAKKLGENGDKYFSEAISIYEKRMKGNINNVDAIMNKAIVLCYMDKKDDAIAFLNTLSLNEENQAFLEQMKMDIRTFDADELLNQLKVEK